MKKISILLLSILLCVSGFPQDPRVMDSLWTVIETTKTDTARVQALVRLSFFETQPSLRLELAFQALQLSKQIKWVVGEALGYNQLSNIYRNIADYPNALDNALKALKIREEIGSPEWIGVAFLNIGTIYGAQNRYEEAITYYTKSEEYYRIAPTISAERRGVQYMSFGRAYILKGNYDSALIYLNRAYEIIPKTSVNLPTIYIGLADVSLQTKILTWPSPIIKKL